jgi:hypothetical protein
MCLNCICNDCKREIKLNELNGFFVHLNVTTKICVSCSKKIFDYKWNTVVDAYLLLDIQMKRLIDIMNFELKKIRNKENDDLFSEIKFVN